MPDSHLEAVPDEASPYAPGTPADLRHRERRSSERDAARRGLAKARAALADPKAVPAELLVVSERLTDTDPHDEEF